MKPLHKTDGFAPGCLLGLYLAWVLLLALDLALAGDAIQTLKDWQGIATGLLALLGAGGTIWIIRRQMNQARQIEEEIRERKSNAARSALPHALSSLVAYARNMAKAIAGAEETYKNTHSESLRGEYTCNKLSRYPKFQLRYIKIIRDCIEHGDTVWSRELGALLSDLQIVRSRLESFVSDAEMQWRGNAGVLKVISLEDFFRRTIDALRLYARAEKVFPYARFRDDSPPLPQNKDGVLLAFRDCDFDEVSQRELLEFINSSFPEEK